MLSRGHVFLIGSYFIQHNINIFLLYVKITEQITYYVYNALPPPAVSLRPRQVAGVLK